jgi:hypothetical protein
MRPFAPTSPVAPVEDLDSDTDLGTFNLSLPIPAAKPVRMMLKKSDRGDGRPSLQQVF